jgi:hypothetical protein
MLENFRALRKFFANQSDLLAPRRQERKVTGL